MIIARCQTKPKKMTPPVQGRKNKTLSSIHLHLTNPWDQLAPKLFDPIYFPTKELHLWRFALKKPSVLDYGCSSASSFKLFIVLPCISLLAGWFFWVGKSKRKSPLLIGLLSKISNGLIIFVRMVLQHFCHNFKAVLDFLF